MATNRRRTSRTTRSSRSAGLRSTAVKVYPAPGGEMAAAPAAPAVPTVNWDKEYHYILKDLRQLGIVSALLFVLLLVAGFLL